MIKSADFVVKSKVAHFSAHLFKKSESSESATNANQLSETYFCRFS